MHQLLQSWLHNRRKPPISFVSYSPIFFHQSFIAAAAAPASSNSLPYHPIIMPDSEDQMLEKDGNTSIPSPLVVKLQSWKWWPLVVVNIFFLLAGQCAAVLLGRFYYDQGGNSKWMATLVQTLGFPVLLIPLILVPSFQTSPSTPSSYSIRTIAFIYFVIGIVIAGDNLLGSRMGNMYLVL